MRILLILVILTFNYYLNAQLVSTLLSHPKIVDGLYVHDDGNLFTTPGGLVNGNTIGKYEPNGNYDPFYASGFAGPINIALWKDSFLVVTNYDNNTVSSLNLFSNNVSILASGFDGPAGIAIDDNNTIYITNYGSPPSFSGSSIYQIDSNGKRIIYIDTIALLRPQGILFGYNNELIVESKNENLYKVNRDSGRVELWTNLGIKVSNMVYRKKDSSIYAAATQYHKIMKIDHQGNVSTFAGSSLGSIDGDVNTAKFNKPLGLAFSHDEDSLYIAESIGRLRIIDFTLTSGSIRRDPAKPELEINPNPTNKGFEVHLKNEGIVEISILDSGMRTIHSVRPGGIQNYINSDLKLNSGLYYIRIKSEHNTYLRKLLFN